MNSFLKSVFFVFSYILLTLVVSLFVSDMLFCTVIVNAIFIIILYKYYFKDDIKFIQKSDINVFLYSLFITFVLYLICFYFNVSIYNYSLQFGGADYIKVKNDNIIVYSILSIFIAPVFEEMVFRGFFKKNTKFLILGSVLFALCHGTLIHLFTGLLIGLWLSLLYCYFDNLLIPIIMHMFYNILTYVPFYTTKSMIGGSFMIIMSLLIVVSIGFMFYNLYVYKKRVVG